ncbi:MULTISPECIES: glycosyltransferase family 4 protein [Mangrovimonas]|uniref:glycosyltransferase family 4 protein n=1 Tax=Mangrovimonas TaxID=1211036 RepID=UPI0006B54D6D|nr:MULTISPECIES: glycosyltransferase family 4 protein [Mangrovimonas]OMP30691.1 group 1 glycosyl transferase [Mangrovimonas sp. DI 80]
MKIHFIISTLKGGGAERVLSILATAFADRDNYEITVLTLNKCKDYYKLPCYIKRISLHKGRIANHKMRSIYNLTKFYYHKKNRPDLIISFITLTNFITIPVAKLYSIKIIVEEHNSYLRSMKNREFITNITKKYFYKKANLLTVLTTFDVAYYKKYGANVVVMPNPCSFPPIKIQPQNREKVILAIGKLDKYYHKGFDNLIELIAPILKSNPDWKLKIAGSGDKGYELLNKLSKKLEVSDRILFTGFVSNISELMLNSSIFILPSRFEGLPMVLLEAMSQGMACISYDCKTGPSDIITNNVNGLLIEDQNKKEMQNNLQNLINDETLRQYLSKNAIKSLDKYQIDTIIKNYESVFEKL